MKALSNRIKKSSFHKHFKAQIDVLELAAGALTDFVPRVSLLSLLSGTGRENLEHKVGAGHVARAFVLRMLPKIPLTRTNSQISVHFTRGGNETFIRFNGS